MVGNSRRKPMQTLLVTNFSETEQSSNRLAHRVSGLIVSAGSYIGDPLSIWIWDPLIVMAGTRRVDPIEVDTKEGGILKTEKGWRENETA